MMILRMCTNLKKMFCIYSNLTVTNLLLESFVSSQPECVLSWMVHLTPWMAFQPIHLKSSARLGKTLPCLARIFHTKSITACGKLIITVLVSNCDLGGMYTYSPASKCSSALPHQASQSPRHDQYEISGLRALRNSDYWSEISFSSVSLVRSVALQISSRDNPNPCNLRATSILPSAFPWAIPSTLPSRSPSRLPSL